MIPPCWCTRDDGCSPHPWSVEKCTPMPTASAEAEIDSHPRVVATEQVTDPVNSPPHYLAYPVEVIEVTEHLNFCKGNVVKYVLRADYKGNPIEDLRKARWYLDREISRLEKEGGSS